MSSAHEQVPGPPPPEQQAREDEAARTRRELHPPGAIDPEPTVRPIVTTMPRTARRMSFKPLSTDTLAETVACAVTAALPSTIFGSFSTGKRMPCAALLRCAEDSELQSG